jgi:hypothetical protein
MTNKKDDGLFRSTYAIPAENKAHLDALVSRLNLNSMADLLNMLAENYHEVADALEDNAKHYTLDKMAKRDLERKIRETQRLRDKLAELEKPAP